MAKPQWFAQGSEKVEAAKDPPVARSRGAQQEVKWPDVFKKETDPATVHAFISSWNKSSKSDVNTYNDEPFYVIIGCGFAGTVDHATLSQTPWGRTRTGQYRILHIGFPDPWRIYHPHDMNQELELLVLPGYMHQPRESDTAEAGRWLYSPAFAGVNQAEFEGCWPRSPETVQAHVTKITKAGEFYRIHFHESDEQILAAKIDICAGPGQTRVPDDSPAGIKLSSNLKEQFTSPPKVDDPNWIPQIVTATNFTRENANVAAGGLVLVSGRGPAAAQALERTLETDGAKEILWATKDINGGFPPTMRLDRLVRVDDMGQLKELPARLGFPKGALYPANDNVWIANGYEVRDVKPLTSRLIEEKGLKDIDGSPLTVEALKLGELDPLLVTFSTGTAAVGSDKSSLPPFLYGVFHQVVVAQGLQDTPNEPGSPIVLLKELLVSGEETLEPYFPGSVQKSPEDPTSRGESVNFKAGVGLRSTNGKIRVLGAAGHGNSIMRTLGGDAFATLDEFQNTLPAQARINFQGVTLSALTIAHANHWFDDYGGHFSRNGNNNPNTATLDEIEARVGTTVARALIEVRIMRIRPYQTWEQLAQAYAYWNATHQTPEFAQTVVTDELLAQYAPNENTLEDFQQKLVLIYPPGVYTR
jgi:hypothetical protein